MGNGEWLANDYVVTDVTDGLLGKRNEFQRCISGSLIDDKLLRIAIAEEICDCHGKFNWRSPNIKIQL